MIDLRSDTFTLPSQAMRDAIYNAEVGDDVYGEDPTVRKLEEKGCELSGKEACLFVSSGCMGNLIAISIQAGRGAEVLCAAQSHIVCHEIGALSSIGLTQPMIVPSTGDGLIIPSGLDNFTRGYAYDMADRPLIEVENTTSGIVYPLESVKSIHAFAKKNGMNVHTDGARIFNAVVETGIPLSTWAQYTDSITFCLSKGLGAPMGSLLCGSAAFIGKARRIRKLLGGGMRQIGFMAAAGLYALENNVERLADDHENARMIKEALEETLWAEIERYGTNMVFFSVHGTDNASIISYFRSKGILALEDAGYIRIVTSLNVDRKQTEEVVKAIKEFRI